MSYFATSAAAAVTPGLPAGRTAKSSRDRPPKRKCHPARRGSPETGNGPVSSASAAGAVGTWPAGSSRLSTAVAAAGRRSSNRRSPGSAVPARDQTNFNVWRPGFSTHTAAAALPGGMPTTASRPSAHFAEPSASRNGSSGRKRGESAGFTISNSAVPIRSLPTRAAWNLRLGNTRHDLRIGYDAACSADAVLEVAPRQANERTTAWFIQDVGELGLGRAEPADGKGIVTCGTIIWNDKRPRGRLISPARGANRGRKCNAGQ